MLSVVLPAFNEAPYLAATVTEVHGKLQARGEPFEVVVVENGSTDGTIEVLRELESAYAEVRGLSLPEANYGFALKRGVLAATGEHVIIFDVDFYDLDFLETAAARLAGPWGPAVVVGSKRGEGATDHRPWHRRLITVVFATVLRLAFGLGGPDTHGIKAFNRHRVGPLVEACRCRYDLFDSELVLRAERAGLSVEYLPVEVREMRAPRSSVLRRIPRTLVGLARLRWTLWRETPTPREQSQPAEA